MLRSQKTLKEYHFKPVWVSLGADSKESLCSPLVCNEWCMNVCVVFMTGCQTNSSPEILYVCVFLKEAQKSCHSHLRWLLSLPSQCCLSQTRRSRDFNVSSSSPLSQMDHVHKALIGSGFGLISPLKRKASSCGVCRLRFSCEVGVVLWETHALNCFSFRVLLYLTHTPSHDS